MDESDIKVEYVSYNGLGRRPMAFGVPYMPALILFTTTILGSTFLALKLDTPAGYLVAILAIPVFMYIKEICRTDDRAVEIVFIETKWTLIKLFSGTARYFGGTLTFAPVRYGRKFQDVKFYFETRSGR
jgi:type IV secretion system protein VirB3